MTVMSHRLRATGVAAVVVVWTSLGLGSVLAGFDLLGDRPLSHLGAEGPAVLLFSGGLALSAVLFVGFHQYVRHSFPVAKTFSVAMLVGMAAQVVAAVFPIGGNDSAHRVHTTSALLLGASLPVLMWRFAASQPPGPWRRRSYALFWAEAAACAVGLWLSARGVAPLAEIVPGAVFHSWILAVTLAPPGLAAVASGPPGSGGGGGNGEDLPGALLGGHALGAAPLGRHHEQRALLGSPEHAREAAAVEVDGLEHLAALGDA